MGRIASHYYREPEQGVLEELRFGDRVYFFDDATGDAGAFLIVNLDYHAARIHGGAHRFTYLGLGCAKGGPMAALFQAARDDFAARLEPGVNAVMHLTTRTPYAIRGLERAFASAMHPRVAGDSVHAKAIAAYIKGTLHRHAERVAGEDPFVLRGLKKARFRDEELERIRNFEGDTALARLCIACDGADEAIVFHHFVA